MGWVKKNKTQNNPCSRLLFKVTIVAFVRILQSWLAEMLANLLSCSSLRLKPFHINPRNKRWTTRFMIPVDIAIFFSYLSIQKSWLFSAAVAITAFPIVRGIWGS